MAEKEYIERETLIKACKKIIHDRWNETTAPVSWSHAYADFIEDIENQPSADVAPVKHGHWVYDHWSEFKCSECGEYSNSKPYKGKEKYCPNCGAKMDSNEVE